MKCYIVLNYIIIHLKTAIKGLSTITIVFCLEKFFFCAFPFHENVPGSNLERNAKNARNVTRLRDLCSSFQNGFLVKNYYINEDTLFKINSEK